MNRMRQSVASNSSKVACSRPEWSTLSTLSRSMWHESHRSLCVLTHSLCIAPVNIVLVFLCNERSLQFHRSCEHIVFWCPQLTNQRNLLRNLEGHQLLLLAHILASLRDLVDDFL